MLREARMKHAAPPAERFRVRGEEVTRLESFSKLLRSILGNDVAKKSNILVLNAS